MELIEEAVVLVLIVEMSPKTKAIPDVGQPHCWISCLCSHAVHEKGLILPPGLPRNRKAEMLYTNEEKKGGRRFSEVFTADALSIQRIS